MHAILAPTSDDREQAPLFDPTGDALPSDVTAAQLIEEMKTAWRQGQRPGAAELLSRYPELRTDPEAAVRIIYEEICLRQECGLEVVSAEVVKQFPQWQAQLKFLLDCHDALQPILAVPIFPKVGETWTDFHLLAELGRGAFGRVFLTTQQSLAGRPIVVKLTTLDEAEHLSLARLQHTHIMPLYMVQDDPARHLRALCMPYFGGTSFHRILGALKDKPISQRTGADILNALDQAQTALPIALPLKGPARQLLARASYAQAVCWIGACLAEALQYAHERGLVHLDIKPHNLLLAADGQPMLLDFNLAREPLRSGVVALDSFGGTPDYMSPEQEFALARIRVHLPIQTAVDGRSDVYSLGLVLYEALGGPVPFSAQASPPHLRACNPQVSVGLIDLIHKCLAQEPCDRYADAAALASDLRRQLADLPLRGVRNRSPCERWRKWRRRQPHALIQAGMLLVLLTVATAVALYAWGHRNRQLREAETALADAQAQWQNQEYDAAVRTLNRGIAIAEGLPAAGPLLQSLGGQLRRVQRTQAAQRLHRLAEHIRFLDGVDPLDPKRIASLEAQCRQVWETRGLMLQGGGELEPGIEEQIRRDLLDLAILWTNLRVWLATESQAAAARQDALERLAEAETRFGPSPALARERQAHAEALGRSDVAEAARRRAAELPARTAWDHYSLGRFLMRSGKLTEALVEFECAIDQRPQEFWSHFGQGTCTYRLHRYADAVHAFAVCVALAPSRGECYYNLALADAALGHSERALHDYSHALQLDSTLAAAALNRGILYYQAKRYDEALRDFQLAWDKGAQATTAQYNMALVYGARHDRARALDSLRRVLESDPQHPEARALHDRLLRQR